MEEATIRTKYKVLKVMLRENVNLTDPEEVKLFIARNKKWSNGHKIIAAYAYNDYTKMENIKWEIPYYKKNETLPFVPTEKEIDALIAGTSKKVSITLQALKETGFRVGELVNCKWTGFRRRKINAPMCSRKTRQTKRSKNIREIISTNQQLTKNKSLDIRNNKYRRNPLDIR
jgi:integrase